MKPIVYFQTLAVGRFLLVTLLGALMLWNTGFSQVPMDVAQMEVIQDTFPTRKGQEKAIPAKRVSEQPEPAVNKEALELERLAASDLYVVTVDDHLHLKPDGNSPVVYILKEGDQVMTTGRTVGFWREVAFLGEKGWVKSILIVPLQNYREAFPEYEFTQPDPADRLPTEEPETLIVQQETSLRTGPSAEYAVLRRLDPNEQVKLLSKTSTLWWRVEVNGETGYVKAFLLKDKKVIIPEPPVEDTPKPDSAVKENEEPAPIMEVRYPAFFLTMETSLRRGPSSQTDVLVRFEVNDRVEVLEETNRFWWRVRYDGMTGYVKAHLLSPEEQY